jgi:hypothetical protein
VWWCAMRGKRRLGTLGMSSCEHSWIHYGRYCRLDILETVFMEFHVAPSKVQSKQKNLLKHSTAQLASQSTCQARRLSSLRVSQPHHFGGAERVRASSGRRRVWAAEWRPHAIVAVCPALQDCHLQRHLDFLALRPHWHASRWMPRTRR